MLPDFKIGDVVFIWVYKNTLIREYVGIIKFKVNNEYFVENVAEERAGWIKKNELRLATAEEIIKYEDEQWTHIIINAKWRAFYVDENYVVFKVKDLYRSSGTPFEIGDYKTDTICIEKKLGEKIANFLCLPIKHAKPIFPL